MATITTINSTDAIADSRGTINNNFANLNTDKVEGPATSTDNAVARYNGTSGDVQDSSVTISDTDVVSGVTQLNVDNVRVDGNTISSTDTNGNIILSPDGTGQVEATTEIVAVNGTATTAGGVKAIDMGSANLSICFGSGVPTLSAAQGSIYLRTDGSSTSTRMYINTDGSTTWTSVTTAA